jgi:hypothetical protein
MRFVRVAFAADGIGPIQSPAALIACDTKNGDEFPRERHQNFSDLAIRLASR